jgi:hypothetical protein
MSQSSSPIVSVLSSVFRELRSGPVSRGPWPADPRSFAVDHPSFLSACSCSVVWSGVHDRSQHVSQRRAADQLPIRADPETIHRSVVQPLTQLVAIGRRSQDQQRQDRHVRLHEFDQGIATASRSAPAIRRRRHPRKQPATAPDPRSNPSTSEPVAARTYLGGPKLATTAFTVCGEHPTTRGCRRHM